MTSAEIDEAVAILTRMLDRLLGVVRTSGVEAFLARAACGVVAADAEALIRSGEIGAQLSVCFARAQAAGASFAAMEEVRQAALAEVPVGGVGRALVDACLWLALCAEARIVAESEYRSREAVDRALDLVNAAFEPSETAAADAMDAEVYRGLTSLHAALARHLADSGRPLPRMVDFLFPSGRPTLALAQRLYGDAARADELRGENGIVHPAFAPPAGRALSF